jgi:hypothetical protein
MPDPVPLWLERFFAAPNGLSWATIVTGGEPPPVAEVLRPWLRLAQEPESTAPIILPFVREGIITGWYAVARSSARCDELRDLLQAWIGLTWASRLEATNPTMADPLATALRDGFAGTVFRLGGADAAANARIGAELIALAALLERRPVRNFSEKRPVGVLRSEFDRALLVGDASRASALIEELKATGRLNDENLRYLDVRLRAGLGLWPQLAHDHWLVRTLSELYLPPQILADLIEALYRTHLDALEQTGDAAALLTAFIEKAGDQYPRLFASRRGVRSPRVVKAFLLFERSQAAPNPQIIEELAGLLPEVDRAREPYASLIAAPQPAPADPLALADEAFEDGQTDRAFEYYLASPVTKRMLGRLILCASLMDTARASEKLSTRIADAGTLIDALTPSLRDKLAELRNKFAARPAGGPALVGVTTTRTDAADDEPEEPQASIASPAVSLGWLEWAQQLRIGQAIALRDDAVITWDTRPVLASPAAASAFADDLGNLAGDPARLARDAVPAIYRAFLDEYAGGAAGKPIASTLFMLIAMDESLSRIDLDLLAQLLGDLILLGMTSAEYLSIVDALSDVEERVGSYVHLAWSLDIAEALAIAPTPSSATDDARRQLFLLVVAKAQAFAHRLRPEERHAFRVLARDYEIEANALGQIGEVEGGEAESLPSLAGKTIGIYTLTEGAGVRAKAALEMMFPGVQVGLNADTVATTRLTSLAKNADYFVFAWRSSSHQAYFCVKAAMGDRDPIMPEGKGTASIIRSLIDALNR